MSFSRYATDDSVISAETVVRGLWSGDSNTLASFFTGSNPTEYYVDVYQVDPSSITASVQFDIQYGNLYGSGSLPINTSLASLGGYTPSRIVYGQYRNLVYGTEDTNFSFDGGVTTARQIYVINVSRERYKDSYFIYRIDEIRQHIPGSATTGQDGIYHLTVMTSNVSPALANVGYGISLKNYNQDVRNLYPQMDRDNYNSDPDATISYANVDPLGKITSNDKRNSVTKEALNSFILENTIGFGITGASVSGTDVTFYTDREHNLNSIKTLSLTSGGSGYGSTTLYSASLVPGTTTGTGAAVKATLSAGSVNVISIVDGGSAYGVGNTMSVVGGTSLATVQAGILYAKRLMLKVFVSQPAAP